MIKQSVTQTRPTVNTVSLPAFSLATFVDVTGFDWTIGEGEGNPIQSTTFPANREGKIYREPWDNVDTPEAARARIANDGLTLAERVAKLRGPVEDGID